MLPRERSCLTVSSAVRHDHGSSPWDCCCIDGISWHERLTRSYRLSHQRGCPSHRVYHEAVPPQCAAYVASFASGGRTKVFEFEVVPVSTRLPADDVGDPPRGLGQSAERQFTRFPLIGGSCRYYTSSPPHTQVRCSSMLGPRHRTDYHLGHWRHHSVSKHLKELASAGRHDCARREARAAKHIPCQREWLPW